MTDEQLSTVLPVDGFPPERAVFRSIHCGRHTRAKRGDPAIDTIANEVRGLHDIRKGARRAVEQASRSLDRRPLAALGVAMTAEVRFNLKTACSNGSRRRPSWRIDAVRGAVRPIAVSPHAAERRSSCAETCSDEPSRR